MAKWEYAAIVRNRDGNEWALRQSELECSSHVEIKISKKSRKFLSWVNRKFELDAKRVDNKIMTTIPHTHSWKDFPEDVELEIHKGAEGVHLYFLEQAKKTKTAKKKREWEEELGAYIVGSEFKPCNQTNKHLFKSNDILGLVNMAGADGWEITGGLGLADGRPGNHETKWRMMRREL